MNEKPRFLRLTSAERDEFLERKSELGVPHVVTDGHECYAEAEELRAWSAAEAEYNGLDEPVDLTDDPVASADESMSYWDADE